MIGVHMPGRTIKNLIENHEALAAERTLLPRTASPVQSAKDIAAEAFAAIKTIVRRGIMTLMTLRDPDRKYHHRVSAWLFPVVNKAQESYGYVQYGFEPTPHDISQMEIVAGWLAWMKRTEGELALRRIISWTLGVPTWRLASRERCSDRTVRNRIDRSIVAIIRNFAAADISVEIIEDGETKNPYKMVFDRPSGPHGGTVILRKVYVYDAGFMIGSKTVRDGRYKADKFES